MVTILLISTILSSSSMSEPQKEIPASASDSDEGEEDLTVLEDVLPSFEMHNYMFNRTIFDTENITSSGKPPGYEDQILGGNSAIEPRDLNNFVDPTRNPNLLLLNNIEKFQKIDLPLSIQIVLTKTAPHLGVAPERENPLRQYKPGDVMHGYIIIENRSDEEIPFEMFLVSLEGEMVVPNPAKPGELIRQSFLKTYDLFACFHYGFIDSAYQGFTSKNRTDDLDHTYLGFDNDRIIYPKKKHKKFFSFKLPRYLLDTSCCDQLPSHLKLPPSFGCDTAAFNTLAKYIKIDPIQGYGRLDRYGSPIKTIDYANESQAISYFINVQFIGRKLDFYKKFYTHETSHEYDFIFLKNVEYNFRIDSSTPHPHEYSVGEMSTYEQMKQIENLVSDKLNEILERKNLNEVGINDPRNQDEIIFSCTSNNKKIEQLNHHNSGGLIPLLTDTKTSVTDMDGFSRVKTVKIVKDLFNKVDGDLTIRVSMHRNAQLRSIKPKQLQLASAKPHSKSNSSLNLNSLATELPADPPSFASITSPPQLTPSSSTESVILRLHEKEYLYIHLSFKGHSSIRNSKPNLPSTITLTPNLKIYNVQSLYPIPVTFDNKFIFNGGFEQDNLQNIRKKFSYYYQQLCEVLKDTDTRLVRTLYNKIHGLSKLHVSEQNIKKFFESQTIDLHNQWKYNQEKNVYECEFQVPLNIDMKSEKVSSYCIVPSFQQCLLSRMYGVDVEVTAKKAKEKLNMKFPIHLT